MEEPAFRPDVAVRKEDGLQPLIATHRTLHILGRRADTEDATLHCDSIHVFADLESFFGGGKHVALAREPHI